MRKVLFIITIIVVALLGSCQTEDWGQAGNSNPVGFTLSYSIDKAISATTRTSVALEEGEDNINSFYILFFENTTGGTGLFQGVIDAMPTDQNVLSSSGSITVNFPSGSNLSHSKEYKMLFCANVESYASSIWESAESIHQAFQGYEEREVINTFLKISGVNPNRDPVEEQLDNSNRMAISNLPMSSTAVKGVRQENIIVELIRAVSRFDVFCQAPGYELVSASVWNALTETLLWSGDFNDFTQERTQRFYGVAANQDREIKGSLYAFENFVKNPEQDDTQTTCLIIGLKNNATGMIEYFRTNIHADNMGQRLLRNNVYRTTVKNVNSTGESTEREAYQNVELKIDIDINGWTLDDSGNFHYDGENILAIPTKVINLSPYGETREYNVFTLGEGTLEISHKEIPENITVELQKNLLIVKANSSNEPVEGIITLSFGKLAGSILIKQQPYETDFLDLNFYELPVFAAAPGQVSPTVQVSSSGPWVAEIYNGSYFSFDSGTIQIDKIEGGPGETFNIQTIQKNTNPEIRYCFVLVKLKDVPNVSRVIVLAQAGTATQYLNFVPTTLATISGGGGYTETITVFASGKWKATLSVSTEATSAVFVEPIDDNDDEEAAGDHENEVVEKTYNEWDSTKGSSFAIKVSNLLVANVPAVITVTFELTGTDIKQTLDINQSALSQNSLMVQTRVSGYAGTLYNMKSAYTSKYAWQMVTNMSDREMFGPDGTIRTTTEYIFSLGKNPSPLTSIYQLTGKVNQSEMQVLINWLKEKDNRLLYIAHNNSHNNESAKQLKAVTGLEYTIHTSSVAASNNRSFVPNPDMNNPLIAYLLDGPFGKVNPDNIQLKSRSSTNRSLSKWPTETFIPLIMAGGNYGSYCILGIDPVNRVIWCSDPGIFGCGPKYSLANRVNFDSNHPDNMKFLNNLIAWMTRAAMDGDLFLRDFR